MSIKLPNEKTKLGHTPQLIHRPAMDICNILFDEGFEIIAIGTAEALSCVKEKTLHILALNNFRPHNGHFEDLMNFLPVVAKENGADKIKITNFFNPRLASHICHKYGFDFIGSDVERSL